MFFSNLLLSASAAALFGAGTAGGTLLGASETDGLAVDFTASTPDLLIRDNSATLNYSGTPFANDGGKLTFSRTSLATVVDDDGLIKWAPHNLIARSTEFNSWSTWGGVSVTANQTTAPDGTSTADLITAPNATNEPAVYIGAASAGTTTARVFAKAGTVNFAWVTMTSSWGLSNYVTIIVDLTTGTVTKTQQSGTGVHVSSSATLAENGFYLISLTVTGITNGSVVMGAVNSGTNSIGSYGNVSWTSTGTETIYLWGAHLYRSDLGGMQDNGTAFPTYNPTTTAAYYGPRIDHDPVTLAKRGLLMEEARTNLFNYSADFSQSVWTTVNATRAATTAPDGTSSATTFDEGTATGNHRLYYAFVTTTNTIQTYSVYLKAGTCSTVRVCNETGGGAHGATVDVDLSAGTLSSVTLLGTGTDGTATITALANGWYRVTLSVDHNQGTQAYPGIYMMSGGSISYTGTNRTVSIWGQQFETGAFPTSYIPTTTASVTRAVDACTIASGIFPVSATEGTLVSAWEDVLPKTGLRTMAAFDTAGASRSYQLYDGSNYIADLVASSAIAASFNHGAQSTGDHKIATAWKVNDFASSFDGGAALTDTVGAAPDISAIELKLGYTATAGRVLNGHLRQITYIPRRLTDAELVTRST